MALATKPSVGQVVRRSSCRYAPNWRPVGPRRVSLTASAQANGSLRSVGHATAASWTPDNVRDADGHFGRATGASTDQILSENPDYLSPEEQMTVRLFEENSPSVANVSTTSTAPFFPFNLQVPRGAGSGFVWDKRGTVVTNAHVVRDASDVSVTLHDGTTAKARIIGRDREKDVAVLRLQLPQERLEALRPLQPGCSSNLRVGQKVFALGNPFGLDQSLSQGVVSGLGREITPPVAGALPITNVIQTDAAINPGNSGGPLLNSRGQLVGINTAILDPTGVGISSGVGFAIPIDAVKGLVEQILKHGRVIRPALGVTIAPVPYPLLQRAGGGAPLPGMPRGQAPVEGGVLVVNVKAGGPADVAGVQPTRRDVFGQVTLGDIITAINSKPIRKQRDLFAVLDTMKVGDSVEVTLFRNGATRVVQTTLADRERGGWGGSE